MKILITGAGGFIGREVMRALGAQPGAEVIALDTNLDGLTPSHSLRLVRGSLTERGVRDAAIGEGVDALLHLAAVPGAAAEQDPAASRRVNLEATMDLFDALAHSGRRPRVVFASTIAVLGDNLPGSGVDDDTPPTPRLVYGCHKAMAEVWLATLHRRGALDAIGLRLPGIVARPKGPSGMQSAFMSELFHTLLEGRSFVSPVSPRATMWLMSIRQVARNLLHALTLDTRRLPERRILTLPALRVHWSALVAEVIQRTGSAEARVSYVPDPACEAVYGSYPKLQTSAAESAGFAHDGTLGALVERALAQLAGS